MVTIQVDEHTARFFERQAADAGMSVADYLRSLVPAPLGANRPKWEELEDQIIALSSAGPSLPGDFSRADIYGDHD